MKRKNWIAIVAMAQNGVIGKENTLPWRIKADMDWYLGETRGQIIVCGRKTLQSIKTLWPENQYFVLTRDETYRSPAENVKVIRDITQVPESDPDGRKIFICGGAEVYAACLPMCQYLYLTTVKKDYAGDAYFPAYKEHFTLEKTQYEDDEILIQIFKRNET